MGLSSGKIMGASGRISPHVAMIEAKQVAWRRLTAPMAAAQVRLGEVGWRRSLGPFEGRAVDLVRANARPACSVGEANCDERRLRQRDLRTAGLAAGTTAAGRLTRFAVSHRVHGARRFGHLHVGRRLQHRHRGRWQVNGHRSRYQSGQPDNGSEQPDQQRSCARHHRVSLT